MGANFSADDMDIFILLLHYCHQCHVSCNVLMISPIQGQAAFGITATVEKHEAILPDLLVTYALTGCDTDASYFGIGEGVGLKLILTGQYKLDLLGMMNGDAPFSDVIGQASKFMLSCCGQVNSTSFTEAGRKHRHSELVEARLVFQTFVHCDPQVKHSRRMWLTPTYRLLFGFFQIRSGMGACAGTIRRCVRFLPVLQGSRSGHPPGRCLVHPQLLEMPINLMQPQGRWSTRWPPPLTRVPCFPSGEQDQHHENEPHVRAAAADTHGLYR